MLVDGCVGLHDIFLFLPVSGRVLLLNKFAVERAVKVDDGKGAR